MIDPSSTDALGVVRDGLGALEVPQRMLDIALQTVPTTVEGVLAYGSRARRDSVDGSDLDLLALVHRPTRSVHAEDVSLSFYTSGQLLDGVGTLFGAHLARDAVVLWDPGGRLASILARMGDVDTDRLFSRSRYLSQVFGSLNVDLPKYLPGLLREARYLLRSCLYAATIAEGRPCFSVRELARRHQDTDLVELLASRPLYEAIIGVLLNCLSRLEAIIGPLPVNQHGSLEALVVNEWEAGGDLLAMGMLALGGSGEADYAAVKKVLL